MTRVSASEAKTHFGALFDQAQQEPVPIEKQGRPVAVVMSVRAYSELQKANPSDNEKKKAVEFLEKWARHPATASPEVALEGERFVRAGPASRGQAI